VILVNEKKRPYEGYELEQKGPTKLTSNYYYYLKELISPQFIGFLEP